LLAAQVAAFPVHVEEAFDDEEPFDVEAEVETEETEGLTDDQPAGEASDGETDADGRKRKRRRRRRGRAGEAREGGPAREENDVPRVASDEAETAGAADSDSEEGVEDGAEDGEVRAEQAAGGERRPRRRGRRGGRRRRGGPEDGLVGSIADELGPTSAPEASGAVADFDGYQPEQAPLPVVQPESVAQVPEQQPPADQHQPEPVRTSSETETAQEAERAARRRSTVREKVSFLVNAQPEAATSQPVDPTPPEPPAPAAPEPTPAAAEDSQPRRAGWWSRRFGGGE
jgi:ribonuclease E